MIWIILIPIVSFPKYIKLTDNKLHLSFTSLYACIVYIDNPKTKRVADLLSLAQSLGFREYLFGIS